jgi:predicted RND superfamily exporter protein
VPIWNEVLERMIPGFLRAAAVALAVLVVLLLLDLRNVRRTALILVPLLISLYLTLALIPVMGMKINVVNIMAFPLILGIGIDDGVHLYHRYLVERNIRKAFSSTGKAILTTTLTTVMAMLTLTLSPHRGMISFGLVASVGITLCLILNLLVLPGLIRTFDRPEDVDKHTHRRTS